MSPVYLAGRALASGRGQTLEAAVHSMMAIQPAPSPGVYTLHEQGVFPYWRIPDTNQCAPWNTRARALVTQVAAQAGAAQARQGALFIATSSLDGESAHDALYAMDFHALARRIGHWLEWEGPVYLVSSACTSAMQALLSALEWLRGGSGTDALVLGLELDNQLTLPGFAALQLLSPSTSQPFAPQRDGLVLGEAVAALRLSATTPTSWILCGGANVVDGTQPTSASADAVTRMCQRALANSGVASQDIDAIKVQAAGSPGNDAAEAQGLLQAFDPMPALLSLKPWIGHCLGASGVAEIALLLELLDRGYWPCSTTATDPLLGVQLASHAPQRLRHVLASILGFGGSHAAVVLKHQAP